MRELGAPSTQTKQNKMTAYQLTGNDYLEANLLPLILAINPSRDQSDIFAALGGDANITSQQSCRICFGNQIEAFFNLVISDVTVNKLEESNRVFIDGKESQIDHLFEDKNGKLCYLEAKCNLNFDSEKTRVSNQKVKLLAESFGDLEPTYFVPVRHQPRNSDVVKYKNHGIKVIAVEELSQRIDLPFTVEEYFTFLLKVCGPIMEDKGMVLKKPD